MTMKFRGVEFSRKLIRLSSRDFIFTDSDPIAIINNVIYGFPPLTLCAVRLPLGRSFMVCGEVEPTWKEVGCVCVWGERRVCVCVWDGRRVCVCVWDGRRVCVYVRKTSKHCLTRTLLKSDWKEILTFQSFQSKGWAPAWPGNKTLALLGRNLNSANL